MKLMIIRSGLVIRITCLLLALHFFNFSIDTRDANTDYVPEDLSVNDIESVIEFFTEDVCGIDNAIAEHDERDNDDGGSFDFFKIFFKSNATGFCTPIFDIIDIKKFQIRNSSEISMVILEINSPPPRS